MPRHGLIRRLQEWAASLRPRPSPCERPQARRQKRNLVVEALEDRCCPSLVSKAIYLRNTYPVPQGQPVHVTLRVVDHFNNDPSGTVTVTSRGGLTVTAPRNGAPTTVTYVPNVNSDDFEMTGGASASVSLSLQSAPQPRVMRIGGTMVTYGGGIRYWVTGVNGPMDVEVQLVSPFGGYTLTQPLDTTVTLSLGNNNTGAALSGGPLTVASQYSNSGVYAVFRSVAINKAGSYTFVVNTSDGATTTSEPLTIAPEPVVPQPTVPQPTAMVPARLSAPRLVAPAAGAVVRDTRPTFIWTRVPGARSYELMLTDVTKGIRRTLRSVVHETGLSRNHFKLGFTLNPEHFYQVRVRAIGAGAQASGWSNQPRFKIAEQRTRDYRIRLLRSFEASIPNTPGGAGAVFQFTIQALTDERGRDALGAPRILTFKGVGLGIDVKLPVGLSSKSSWADLTTSTSTTSSGFRVGGTILVYPAISLGPLSPTDTRLTISFIKSPKQKFVTHLRLSSTGLGVTALAQYRGTWTVGGYDMSLWPNSVIDLR